LGFASRRSSAKSGKGRIEVSVKTSGRRGNSPKKAGFSVRNQILLAKELRTHVHPGVGEKGGSDAYQVGEDVEAARTNTNW